MWVLIVATFLSWGNPQGAVSVHDIRLNTKTACVTAAEKLNEMARIIDSRNAVQAFCVFDPK